MFFFILFENFHFGIKNALLIQKVTVFTIGIWHYHFQKKLKIFINSFVRLLRDPKKSQTRSLPTSTRASHGKIHRLETRYAMALLVLVAQDHWNKFHCASHSTSLLILNKSKWVGENISLRNSGYVWLGGANIFFDPLNRGGVYSFFDRLNRDQDFVPAEEWRGKWGIVSGPFWFSCDN